MILIYLFRNQQPAWTISRSAWTFKICPQPTLSHKVNDIYNSADLDFGKMGINHPSQQQLDPTHLNQIYMKSWKAGGAHYGWTIL